MNKKIANAINTIAAYKKQETMTRSMYRLANSSLPKKKQKYYDDLATQSQVKLFNATQKNTQALNKLSPEEHQELLQIIGW